MQPDGRLAGNIMGHAMGGIRAAFDQWGVHTPGDLVDYLRRSWPGRPGWFREMTYANEHVQQRLAQEAGVEQALGVLARLSASHWRR